jgi:class 3 adenylate cyclase
MRNAIRNDSEFFGRRQELEMIFSRLEAPQPQSVEIIGQRRIGKSSLLHAIRNRRSTVLRHADAYIMVFLDSQMLLGATVPRFYKDLLAQVESVNPQLAVGNTNPDHDTVFELIRRIDKAKLRLVLLLDEFDLVTKSKHFDGEFFGFLRSWANSYPVAFVLTTARDIQDHCHSEISGSPFFNIFTKLNLGPFPDGEAKELIEVPSAQAGFPLAAYTASILSMAGYYPLFIQIACSAFFDYLSLHPGEIAPDVKWVIEHYYANAQPFFERMWRVLSEKEKGLCRNIARGLPISEGDASFTVNLCSRGVLRKSVSQFRLFSDVFEEFVKTKPDHHVSVAVPTVSTELPLPEAKDETSYGSAEALIKKRLDIDEQLRQRFLNNVAVVYIDLCSSTEYAERNGPFAALSLVKKLEQVASRVISQYGGKKLKLVGDAIIATFVNVPDSVSASIALQQKLAESNAQLPERDHFWVKIAINFGEAICVENDVYGDAINGAERVLRESRQNEVVISEYVRRRLPDELSEKFVPKGVFTLKGKAKPAHLYYWAQSQPSDVEQDISSEQHAVSASRTIAIRTETLPRPNNPWRSGSFYLTVLVVTLTVIMIGAKWVTLSALSLVIAAGLVALIAIGAFQLRQDSNLTERGFLELVTALLRRLKLWSPASPKTGIAVLDDKRIPSVKVDEKVQERRSG